MKLSMGNIAPDTSDGNWHDPLRCRARAFPPDARIDGMRRPLCWIGQLNLCELVQVSRNLSLEEMREFVGTLFSPVGFSCHGV